MSLPTSVSYLIMLFAVGACSSRSRTRTTPATVPTFDARKFSQPSEITNPYFRLVPGTTHLHVVEDDGSVEIVAVEVLASTRTVAGISCRVVRDRVYEDGLLKEDTHDWYAQDDAGNVWYMGEEVVNYEYDDEGNLLATNNAGAWEAGVDIAGRGSLASAGYAMKAQPRVGDRYSQEYYKGAAEDMGEVVATAVPITLIDGTQVACVHVRDTTPLEPGLVEDKFFAPGLGLVREVGATKLGQRVGGFEPGSDRVPDFAAATFSNPTQIDAVLLGFPAGVAWTYLAETEDGPESIVVERLDATRTVMGIACAVVRDRVFLEGLLIEDTRDWYAQDDAGNVWYMGEEVDNYEYDDAGNLVSMDHAGSWEAGLDVAGTGTVAQPGYQLPAGAAVGMSYHQEYYEGQALDMALVIATAAEVAGAGGETYTGCLQTLDWNPLAPDGIEFKYYAPGLGLVREEGLHNDEVLQLRGRFAMGASRVPDVAAAVFTNPLAIDHPLHPLPVGGSWRYEKTTDEGLEVIQVVVEPGSRVVLGIDCVVVRDTVTLDGVLLEDTRDWYAQDDAGNVWYMGEEVINYEYDAAGNLIGTNNDGSWEAGLDVANVGVVAQPGYQMPAVPVAGTSYYQEFYPDQAEDMGYVVATGVEVVVRGQTYAGCLQTLDWNPLAPDAYEYKFFAPGVGFVKEEHLTDRETLEYTGR